MAHFLLDHEEGCNPVNPCSSCQAAELLRAERRSLDLLSDIVMLAHSFYGSPLENEYATGGIFDTSVGSLELTVRTANCLKNAGIKTVGGLVRHSESKLSRTHGFGRKSLYEINELLQHLDNRLHLGMSAVETKLLVESDLSETPEDEDS